MKTIKIVLLLLAFSAVAFYSCADSNPIEKQTVATQKSIALRTALNEIKNANDISGKPANAEGKTALTNPFCFEFVYPITLSFSNGANVSIANFQGLLDILESETAILHIVGISFPFQVTYGGAVHTITTETNFTALIQTCGFNTFILDLEQSFCFDIVYPIELQPGDDFTQTINSQEELQAYLNEHANSGVAILFPISVIYINQTVVINNLYELYQVISYCDTCICTQEYAPVCVQTPAGIVEYGNICQAECAGYTQNDLVPCNGQVDCSISNVTATPGVCNDNGTYPLTINFSYNATVTYFNLYNGGNLLIGTFPMSSLPLTILSYQVSPTTIDNIRIQINENCIGYASWSPPNCACVCTTEYAPVCVQTATGIVQFTNASCASCAGYTPNDFITCGVITNNFGTQLGSCFNIQYPVSVQHQGALVTVHSNGELLQYWFPALGPMPLLNYPVTTEFNNMPYTFNSQAEFQNQINASCN